MRSHSLIIDLEGPELTAEEKELILHPLVAGIILFTRNYDSRDQVVQLIRALRERRSDLLITVDHEGGRVQRFREDFFPLPAVGQIGALYQTDAMLAKQVAEKVGWLMAYELLTLGIDLSYAPVVDIDYGLNPMLASRCFHQKPELVADLTVCYIHGMRRAGMNAVLKHFPGHGGVVGDSHKMLPCDERDWQQLSTQDMQPFQRGIVEKVGAIMSSHVVYPVVDDHPATFSHTWLHDILREKMGFAGLIISDDLSMQGAQVLGDAVDRVRAAASAGCDLMLLCNDRGAAISVLDSLAGSLHKDAIDINRLRAKTFYSPKRDAHPQWQSTIDWLRRIMQ